MLDFRLRFLRPENLHGALRHGQAGHQGGAGYYRIAEIGMIENGSAMASFMTFGDTVRIEMKDGDRHSIFGAIEQTVQQYEMG